MANLLMPAHRMAVSDETPVAQPTSDAQGMQHPLKQTPQLVADGIATDWNAVHANLGSFADKHSTL